MVPIHRVSALVEVMAWHSEDDKTSADPMSLQVYDALLNNLLTMNKQNKK